MLPSVLCLTCKYIVYAVEEHVTENMYSLRRLPLSLALSHKSEWNSPLASSYLIYIWSVLHTCPSSIYWKYSTICKIAGYVPFTYYIGIVRGWESAKETNSLPFFIWCNNCSKILFYWLRNTRILTNLAEINQNGTNITFSAL